MVASALAACSAITAYTFYLHSLGTMTVIAVLPIGTAFTLAYLRDSQPRNLVVPIVIVAGMYYNYFPGFAILIISVGAAMVVTVLRRRSAIPSVLILSGAIALVIFVASTSHAVIILRRLIHESTSGRLAASEELLVTFSLVLTERGLPFFWGLLPPFRAAAPIFGNALLGESLFLVLGAALFLILAMAAFRRISGMCLEFSAGVMAILALLVLYGIIGNGYGGFKVVAYMHGLALTAMVGTGLALWHRSWISGNRVLSLAPAVLLVAFAGFNIANSITLGRESFGKRPGMSNAPGLQLKNFRDLQAVAARWGQSGIVIALPDNVTQNWVVPFLRPSVAEFFPKIDLNIEDSAPRPVRDAPIGKYVLHFTDDSQELFRARPTAALWQNEKFALTPLEECTDFMIFGKGWYRKEGVSQSSYEWQRHFRWLRRRGELLILNPSTVPKRLLISMHVGYGGASLQRHVDLYLNGVKFDELEFSGQARLLTRPFTPSGPWSQLEFEVRETVSPLTRTHALWNRWVPADSRHLNVAVSDIDLIDTSQMDSVSQSAVEFGPGKRMTVLTRGVYADGWASEAAQASLRVPASVAALEISGTIPGTRALKFPYVIPISIDGVAVDDVRVEKAGTFHIRVPVARHKLISGQSAILKLGPLPTFVENSSNPSVHAKISVDLAGSTCLRQLQRSARRRDCPRRGARSKLIDDMAGNFPKGLSVIVPVYNSETILPLLVSRLEPVLRGNAAAFELILVNDCSKDRSWEVICLLGSKHDWLVGVNLMRNYSQHNALLCGIRRARYDIIVTLDDDLQHPPELIPILLDRLAEGFDVVYGTPKKESHGILRDLASRITKITLQGAMGAETARSVSALRAFRTELRDGFEQYCGPFVSIDVLLTWATTRFTAIPVPHERRVYGQSNYTLGKLLIHALNMMTGFSVWPLQLTSMVGFCFTVFGLLVLLYVLLRYMISGTSVPGFPFLASLIAVFSGAQMFALGIMGEYLARIHFRTMDRPAYVIREVTGSTTALPLRRQHLRGRSELISACSGR